MQVDMYTRWDANKIHKNHTHVHIQVHTHVVYVLGYHRLDCTCISLVHANMIKACSSPLHSIQDVPHNSLRCGKKVYQGMLLVRTSLMFTCTHQSSKHVLTVCEINRVWVIGNYHSALSSHPTKDKWVVSSMQLCPYAILNVN